MRRWSESEHRKLLEMWRAGACRTEIAVALDCPPAHVTAQISWLRAKGERAVPIRGKGNRMHKRRESEVAPETGYVVTNAVPPAIIYDAYGKPTGWVLDPLTRKRRPA